LTLPYLACETFKLKYVHVGNRCLFSCILSSDVKQHELLSENFSRIPTAFLQPAALHDRRTPLSRFSMPPTPWRKRLCTPVLQPSPLFFLFLLERGQPFRQWSFPGLRQSFIPCSPCPFRSLLNGKCVFFTSQDWSHFRCFVTFLCFPRQLADLLVSSAGPQPFYPPIPLI